MSANHGHHHDQPVHDNSQFVFDNKTKMFTLGLAVLGVVCLLVTYLTGGEHDNIRFWTNFLQNSVFFSGIAFASLFFIATHTVAWGGWQTIFKRVPEAMMMFLPVGLILMLVVAVAVAMDLPGTDFLYLWSNEDILDSSKEGFDKLAYHKSSFLNTTSFFLTLAVVGIWTLFAAGIRRLSINQDADKSLRKVNYQKIHRLAAIFLPIAGFSSAYVIWLWVMSVDVHWYSTLFAWYATVSVWVSAICLMFLIILFLRSRGHLQYFTKEHMHDMGKYIFGFSVFWTYLWFSQFLLIWYANNGEETQYFFLRFEQFPAVFYLNLFINFVMPFLILMINNAKRSVGTLGFAAALVLFGHWMDYYQMIKPGVWYNWEHAQHAKHDAHGHDGHDHKEGDAKHNEEHKGHSDVYKLNSTEAPKAQLTNYQDAHHGDAHNAAPTADTAHADTHADTTHHAEHHADEHKHDDHHATTDAHNHDGHDDHAHAHHAHGHEFVMGIQFPGLLEIGTMLGFLGLFLFVTFTFLAKASLMPKNDPYVEESKNHHVWYDL